MKRTIFIILCVFAYVIFLPACRPSKKDAKPKAPELIGSPSIEGNKIVLLFSADLDKLDKTKVVVKKTTSDGTESILKEGADRDYTITKNGNKLEIILANRTEGDVYQVKLAAGAVESQKIASLAIAFSEASNTTAGILAENLWILGKKITVLFNKNIAIKDSSKITVQKTTDQGNSYSSLKSFNAAVETNKKQLSITLADYPVAGEKYKVNFEAGAMNENGNAPNENELISAEGPVVTTGPAFIAVNSYYMGGENTDSLVIIFNETDLELVDKSLIKYKKDNGAFGPIPSSVSMGG